MADHFAAASISCGVFPHTLCFRAGDQSCRYGCPSATVHGHSIHQSDWHIHLTLNLGNFKYLFTDEVYGLSYFYSIKTAFFSTLICLALGYPMAYAIARTSKSTQSVLLLIIILPFWTSFLLRVYALEGIIRETGLLNSALLWLGIIDHP